MSDHDPHESSILPRRDFLKLGGAAAAGLVAKDLLGVEARAADRRALPPLPANPATRDAMPTRNLGGTAITSVISDSRNLACSFASSNII